MVPPGRGPGQYNTPVNDAKALENHAERAQPGKSGMSNGEN
jgi:hypothetical protein